MNIKKVTICAAGLLILFFLVSCGYKFSGKEKVDGGISELNVFMFKNFTIETQVSPIITNDLINEFSRGGITILNRFGEVGNKSVTTLTGAIKLISTETISRITVSVSNERRIKIAVDVKLTAAGGKTFRLLENITEQEDYKVYDEKQHSENAKNNAIKILSKRLAEKIYLMLTEDF
ncbi:MAG: hypothetical protein JRJ44_05035 [Deltaproteobacteria bacterium]|nr:hypothetical protein [Deltaproteobacteria bacterium]